METTESARTVRSPWNKGKLVGEKAPFKRKEIWAIRVRLQLAVRRRELALFNLAIDSRLRACCRPRKAEGTGCLARSDRGITDDRVAAKDPKARPVRDYRADTGSCRSLDRSCGLTAEDSLFSSRFHSSTHLSTRQYARIVDSWVRQLGLDKASSATHTLRRTKATMIYRRTKNLRAVQLLLGHTGWRVRSATSVLRSCPGDGRAN
jgi:integrase